MLGDVKSPRAPSARSARSEAELSNRVDGDGQTALHRAAAANDLKTVLSLLRAGAEVNAKTLRGETPLHKAVLAHAADVARKLIENGAKVDLLDAAGYNPPSRSFDPPPGTAPSISRRGRGRSTSCATFAPWRGGQVTARGGPLAPRVCDRATATRPSTPHSPTASLNARRC